MKRRSKSSPPFAKRPVTAPGTPGPFTADLARDQRQRDFPGASPTSTKKTEALRKQLFQPSLMVRTRAGTTMNSSGSSTNTPAPLQVTPPSQEHDTSIEDLPPFRPNVVIEEIPRGVPNRREREPADIHDLVTQQTEVLAGMLAELRARQGQAIPQVAGAEAAADPNFDWSRTAVRDFVSSARRRTSAKDGGVPTRESPHLGGTRPTRGTVRLADDVTLARPR